MCGDKSFLVEYRENYENGYTCLGEKRIDLVIFSIFGIIFSLLSSILIVFFYRNNEFRD